MNTPNFESLNKKLNQKVYSMKYIVGIPKPTITKWKNISLIPLQKDESDNSGWLKYSLIDILWIGLVEELKRFGFVNELIFKVKDQLLEYNDKIKDQKVENFNLAVIEALAFANPNYIVVDEDGNSKILSGYGLIDLIQSNQITNHLVLSLNQLIKLNIESLYNEPSLDEFKGLTKDEIQVLLILRSENFETVKITKKDGEINTIESTEIVSNSERILNILKDHDYQDIEIKQARGRVVQIKRTIKERA